MKNLPRMPGHTTSTLYTSTSADSAPSSCWAAASLSVDDVVDVTTVALWPVFLDHASTPSLQTSNSLPTEPHEIAISTDPGAGAADLAAPSAGGGLAASSFLQPR